MTMAKNIGVVKWFDGAERNYGFITFLSGNDNPGGQVDFFFHGNAIAFLSTPQRNDIVSFDVVNGKKDLNAVNVVVIDSAQALANEIDFIDEAACKNIYKKLLSVKSWAFVEKFIAAAPEENFRKYSWLRNKLGIQKHIELCLAMYAETPSPELESEMTDLLARVYFGTKFRIPPELAVKKFFREHSDDESKLAAVEKFFDTLTVEDIADMTKDFSPEKIIDTVKDKATFSEKFPALIKSCVASKLDDWAKVIFAHDLPLEIILPRLRELNDENKLTAVEKYFDALTVEDIADLTKYFPPEKIIGAVKDKATFSEKLPVIIERSFGLNAQFAWACWFVDNAELFRQTKIDEDILIFFMYESIRRWNGQLNDLNALIKLLQEKTDDIEAAPRAKIVYSYICAAFAKRYAEYRETARYLSKRDEFIADTEKIFTEIFNRLTSKIKAKAENPDDIQAAKDFNDFFDVCIRYVGDSTIRVPKHDAQLLPPCSQNHSDENCVFCEAVMWNKKVVDEDGTITWKPQSWCPRTISSENCSRLFPNVERSAKDWSVVELTAKLSLDLYNNRDFFTRLGGEFNRIKDLLERLKCRKCGKYMRAVKGLATWKNITNLTGTKYGQHFAIFAATTFSCQNDGCPEKGKPVYMSYCWNCGENIDSRDNPVRIRGFYLCGKCGAGYKDLVGDEHYAIFPGEICPSCTKCPKCGGQQFDMIETADGKFQLQCTNCNHVMNAPQTLKNTSNSATYRKRECSCKHQLEWNQPKLEKHIEMYKLNPVSWAK